MRVKGIIEEDFTNFKLPAMFINTSFCDFKCCTESNLGIEVCQNAPLAQAPSKDIPNSVIYQHFANNPITKAVVIGGMEPFLQIDEVRAKEDMEPLGFKWVRIGLNDVLLDVEKGIVYTPNMNAVADLNNPKGGEGNED